MSDESRVELSRITIRRFLCNDGTDMFAVQSVRPDGAALPLVESLGLLELAKADLLAPMLEGG